MTDNDKDKGPNPIVIVLGSLLFIVFIIVVMYLLNKHAGVDFF